MKRVLIVEDDEFSRDILTRRLARSGFEILAAADGREGVIAARLHRPDVILMDLDMPVMDGRTAIRSLRNDPRTYRIPIIVLSAHSSPEDVTTAADQGCQAYEAKPIVFRRLLERIAEVLESANLSQS
jgi:CheY-like chemotaxis protein